MFFKTSKIKAVAFWIMTPYSSLYGYDVSEEPAVSSSGTNDRGNRLLRNFGNHSHRYAVPEP